MASDEWESMMIELDAVSQVLLLLMFTAGGVVLGRIPGRAGLLGRVERAEKNAAAAEKLSVEHQRSSENMWERCRESDEQIRTLQLSVVQIPEIAQRLSGVRDLREIPEHALDLCQEIFEPSYSMFYRVNKGQLVAVSRRGSCEFNVGHQLEPGEGLVGWTAVKQLPITPEDCEHENAVVKQRNLDRCMPSRGFSLTLPIVAGERTVGVILMGPSPRTMPHAREIGRTIAMITAVAITSTLVLKKEQLMAKTDGLTGLLNKTSIYQRLVDLISAETPPSKVSIFLLDIDHFKNYNDTNGHLPGDELLQGLGRLLSENSRQNEHIGRYGGEEFLLVLEDATKDEALAAAERIREMVETTAFAHRELQPGGAVTISGGVATWPLDAGDVDSLIRSADEALYAAKGAGRNRVVVCDSSGSGSEVAAEAFALDGELEKIE